MEFEKAPITAKIERKTNPQKKKKLVTFYIIIISILLLGFLTSQFYDYPAETDDGIYSIGYGRIKPAHTNTYINWWFIPIFGQYYTWVDWAYSLRYLPENYFTIFAYLLIILYVLLLSAPLLSYWHENRLGKNTKLSVSNNAIFGTYFKFISQKNLQMPLQNIINITVENGFWDRKLRKAETVFIETTKGKMKFHYVKNAEDFVSNTMQEINKTRIGVNSFVNNSNLHNTENKTTNSVDGSNQSATGKLKELSEMKNAGLITEREYNAKKTDIISTM